jgi:DNA-binding GntR family transcriptional regulator
MPVPEHQATVERHLLRDTAYARLCDAIVTGTLVPGEQLHDGELCAWLGLSRTPVRDALSRLEDEGLVETAPQRYTRVTPLRVADARHAFPVLAVLHGLATELAVPRLLPGDLVALDAAHEAFLEALRSGTREAVFAADERFHGVFVARAGNPEIGRALERMTPALHRVQRLTGLHLPGGRSVAQHQAIITRAASGDAPGTASAARANWMTLGALVERSLNGA